MKNDNIENSKNWKKRFNLSNFYYSFIFSFSWAFLYLWLCRFVESPLKKIFPLEKKDFFLSSNTYFFLSSFFSFLLGLFSILFPTSSYFDLESSFISKFLKSSLYCLIRIFSSGTFGYILENYSSKTKILYLLIFSYLFYFFSNYVTEIIIVQIEKQGIFEGFSLVYLIDNFYYLGNYLLFSLNFLEFDSSFFLKFKVKDLKSVFFSFFLFLMFEISALMSAIKWEVPVETNTFYSPFKNKKHYFLENSDEDRTKFSLNFKLDSYSMTNFQFYFRILSEFVQNFSNFALFLKKMLNFPSFRYESLSLSIFLISFPFYLLHNYFVQSKQFSLDLKRRGVYFDGIAFDDETRVFLFKRTTQIFLIKSLVLWTIILSYKFLVDNNFSYFSPECLQILAFISGILHALDQTKNYWNFMAFYE